MAWTYEIADGDPINKCWKAFCELAQVLRARIILTDGDDAEAPEYELPDGSTAKSIALSDYVGSRLKDQLLADNVAALRAGILTNNSTTGSTHFGSDWLNLAKTKRITSISTLLAEGSHGTSWLSDSLVFTPAYWEQLFDAMGELRYMAHYLISGSVNGYAGEFDLVEGTYGYDTSPTPGTSASYTTAFSDYSGSLSTTTYETPPNESPDFVSMGAALRTSRTATPPAASIPYTAYIYIGNLYNNDAGAMVVVDTCSRIDYTAMFDAFYAAVPGTIIASGTGLRLFPRPTITQEVPSNAALVQLNSIAIANDHISNNATWTGGSADSYYFEDLEGAKITFGELTIEQLEQEADVTFDPELTQLPQAGAESHASAGLCVEPVNGAGFVFSGADVSINNANYYFSDLGDPSGLA